MSPVIGIAIVVPGLILLPAPEPGIPVVIFGLALVAEHFPWAAILLDRCERPLRSILALWIGGWKRASVLQRGGTAIFAILLLLSLGATLFALLTN